MAQVEPMDVDSIESDFDNKENAFHHNNVLPRTPCTEKGYEELDVSELNMKLRYSITPASSPMTKSLTGPCSDNRFCSTEDYPSSAVGAENVNLTRSLNSSLNKTDGLNKSKVLPLQTLSTATFVDGNRNPANRNRLVDPCEISVTLNSPNEIDENLSVPSTCSSMPETPEATTPTKDIPKPEGSPIMRGLKSVLSMFRPSQSPITPGEENATRQDIPSSGDLNQVEVNVQISTPVVSKHRDTSSSKRSSPLKESLVFNDDLERELQWKDDSAIFFKGERVPVHKLFLNNPTNEILSSDTVDTTVEYMDISANESNLENKTITSIIPNLESDNKEHHNIAIESDNEFLDCETTFSRNESYVIECNKLEIDNQVNNNENNMQKPSKEMATENQTTTSPVNPIVTLCIEKPIPSIPDFQNTCVGNDTDELNKLTNTTTSLTSKNIDFNIPPALNSTFKSENANLLTSPQVNVESPLLEASSTNTTLPIEEVKQDFDLKYTAKDPSPSKFKVKNDNITSEDFENKDNYPVDEIGDQDACKNIIFNITQDCPIMLNNVNEFNNELAQGTKTNLKTETDSIIEDINSGFSTLNKEAENIEKSIIIDSVPNLQEPSISNNLESTNYVNRQQGSEFLNMNENNLMLNTCKYAAHSTPVLYENNKTIDNAPLRDLNDDVDNMLTKHSMDTSLQLQDKILIVPHSTYIAVSKLDTHSNVSHFDIESNINIVPTEKSCETNNSEETNKAVNSEDTSYICSNMLQVLDNSSGNDGALFELPVGNDVTEKLSPSQIPLPDEDEIEQKLLANNIMNKEQDNRKDPINTTIEICIGRSVAAVENELPKDCIEHNNDDISNSIEKNKTSYMINDSQVLISGNLFEKDVDVIQSCDQLSHDHTMEGGPINTSNENMILDKASSDLPISHDTSFYEENPPKNTSMQEVSCNNEEVVKIPNDTNKVAGNEVYSNTVTLSETDLVDNIEPGNIVVHNVSNESEKPNNDALEYRDYAGEKEKQEIDKEIITSANNSPYVSVTDLATDTEEILEKSKDEINNASTTNTQASSPCISPKIVSKGYNFNFDDIDDPFATKTKIRLSPTPDAPNQSFDTFTKVKEVSPKMSKQNKRISQVERKRPISRKTSNTTYSEELKKCESEQLIDSENRSSTNTDMKNISTSVEINLPKAKSHDNVYQNLNKTAELNNSESATRGSHVSSSVKKDVIQHEYNPAEEIKYLEKALKVSTEKSTSSEQYFSLGTSSGESSSLINKSKNVFNLPEIDDMNFNPFATKSKMRISPPPSTEKQINAIQSDNDVGNSSYVREHQADIKVKDAILTFDKNVTRDTSPNTSNATFSSQNTNERNVLDKEINTEDEDTIEGPFLEAEDFKERTSEKVIEMEVDTEMINFSEPSRQEKDENGENGELFIDADAFEFLLNQNKSTTVLDSGKESLFLKFDPLFSKRVSSDGILAAISKAQKRQSTPKKVAPIQNDLISIEKPVAGSSHDSQNCGVNEDLNEDLSSNISKPMMVVNPAVSSFTTQKKSATPKLNRRSLTFTSPAIAVIDRLLSLSGNSSNLDYDTSIPQVGRAHTETDLAITQLRELLAEKEINVHSLRTESKELKDRISVLEVQMRGLETESAKRLAKINELNDRLLEKTKMNKNMATVVEEYERTIASLIAENEHDKKRNAEERIRLIKERDEQTTHLTSMEVSFSDLHSKYEKSKQIILTCKANEDICRKSIKEFQENLSKMQNNYELLKQHATSKLNHANQELEKMNRAHEAEVLKLSAMIKRKELHITSLEETLAQKTKANEELTAICDELINKVG